MISKENRKERRKKKLVIRKAKQKQESESPARSLRLDTTETSESHEKQANSNTNRVTKLKAQPTLKKAKEGKLPLPICRLPLTKCMCKPNSPFPLQTMQQQIFQRPATAPKTGLTGLANRSDRFPTPVTDQHRNRSDRFPNRWDRFFPGTKAQKCNKMHKA